MSTRKVNKLWLLVLAYCIIHCVSSMPSQLKHTLLTYSRNTTLAPVTATDHMRMAVIFPSVVILFLIIFTIALAFYYDKPAEPKNQEPQEQFADILCDSSTANYEYKAIFRVGSPSPMFDMKHGYVDFEILGPNDLSLGYQVRFNCSLLPKNGEMHYLFGRLTPAPPITGIRAQHGDLSGNIMLFDYILVDLEEDRLLDERQFNKNITNKPTIFRGVRPTLPIQPKEDDLSDLELLLQWTGLELSVFFCFIALFIGSIIMMMEYLNLHLFNTSNDGSLFRSLTDVIIASLLSLIIHIIVLFLYKYKFKKKLVKPNGKCLYGSYIFLGALTLVCILLALGLIYMAMDISLIKAVYWFATFFVVLISVTGPWYLYETYLLLKNQPATEPVAIIPLKSKVPSKGTYVVRSVNHGNGFQTVFFDHKASKWSKCPESSFATNVKLFNPVANVSGKNSKQKLSKAKKTANKVFKMVKIKDKHIETSSLCQSSDKSSSSSHLKHTHCTKQSRNFKNKASLNRNKKK